MKCFSRSYRGYDVGVKAFLLGCLRESGKMETTMLFGG